MIFSFDLHKTIEATAVVLQQHGGRATRLRLLKLLYIADREMLAETGRSITGDHPFAMEHGPVLDDTYRLIKGTGFHTQTWDAYFARDTFGGPGVTMIREPGIRRLSRFEVEKLQSISQRFATSDDWDLSKLTHGFAEWIQVYGERIGQNTSVRIPDDSLLAAVGRSGDRARLESEVAADDEWAAMFAAVASDDGQKSSGVSR